MIKRTIPVTIVAVLILTSAFMSAKRPANSEKDVDEDKAAAKRDMAKVVRSGNAFAAGLYAKLASKETGNLFFSPASIHTALAMTCAGARCDTEAQMSKVLQFASKGTWRHVKEPDGTGGKWVKTEDEAWDRQSLHSAFAALIKDLNTPRLDYRKKPAYELVVANALWGQKGYPFRGEFIKLVKDNYGAGLNEVDFAQSEAARQTINKWVEKQTKDKIKDLIPRDVLSALTRLVLTNAIYFKSNWAEKFQKGATRDGEFTLSAGKTLTAPMMHQRKKHRYMETDAFQAVELPYRYHDLSMFVFLPKKADGLAEFEKSLTAKNLGKWLKQFSHEEVILTLPKFKFSSQFRLEEVLQSMGMTDAFDAAAADFSGMTTMEKLHISAVIHKAFVAVDETEAAAATAVIMDRGGAVAVDAQRA